MRTFIKNTVIWLLRVEAKAVLKKYKPKVVAVTGSVGKTSAKDAIFAVLAASGARVRKSEKSFNSEIGLPLTVLGVPNAWRNPLHWLQNILDGLFLIVFEAQYPEWLVLEVGADRPGDISSLVGWLPVDVAVITRLPEVPVHVEFFVSADAVAQEKAALIDCIKPGGTLLLFADDERTLKLEHRLPAPDAKVMTFGFGGRAEVRGTHFEVLRERDLTGRVEGGVAVGMRGGIQVGCRELPVELKGAVGAHAFLPLIAAAAVGQALGLEHEDIAEGLGGYKPPPGRMRLLPGIKHTLVVDDTYNASPAAAAAALEALQLLSGKGRRVAALADMMELGRHSVEEHRKLGVLAARMCDVLVTVGFRARDTAQAALDQGLHEQHVFQYEDSRQAGRELQNILQEGDVVLCKGSQSMRMERVVEEVMQEPERAGELLVRQDVEWKRR